MKNKLRLVVNWVTILAMPLWCLFVFGYNIISDFRNKSPEAIKTFIKGERFWWE